MAFINTPEEQERYLHRVECAAGAAVGNGCSPETVRRVVEAGIADQLELDDRLRRAELGQFDDDPQPLPTDVTATPALDAFVAQFRR